MFAPIREDSHDQRFITQERGNNAVRRALLTDGKTD
jgi:hypothetical protein